jgi:hypothetical protein
MQFNSGNIYEIPNQKRKYAFYFENKQHPFGMFALFFEKPRLDVRTETVELLPFIYKTYDDFSIEQMLDFRLVCAFKRFGFEDDVKDVIDDYSNEMRETIQEVCLSKMEAGILLNAIGSKEVVVKVKKL